MSKKPLPRLFRRSLILPSLLLITSSVFAQSGAFAYQGRLTDGGNPANGPYDMEFKLFDTADVGTGTQQGSTVANGSVQVTNGVFAVELDFGLGVFDGSPRFLEIAIRPAGSTNPYTVLSPRQIITSTPYALRSTNSAAADGLSVACVNCVTSSQIASVSGEQVTGVIPVESLPVGSDNYIQNAVATARRGVKGAAQEGGFDITGDGVIAGTLAVGTVTPTDGTKIDVSGGPVRISFAPNKLIQFGTPNSETGVSIQQAVGTGRADVRFDGSTLKLVAVSGNFVPPNQNGIVIDTTGNVGVGTANMTPDYRLDINGRAIIRTTGSGGVQFGSPNSETGMAITYPYVPPFTSRADIRFDGSSLKLVTVSGNLVPSNTNGIAINTTGNVGIGTSSPVNKLHVEGTGIIQTLVKSTNERAILALESTINGQRRVWTLESGVGGNPGRFAIYDQTAFQERLAIDATGLVGVKALQIMGGGDFSENFDVREAKSPVTKEVERGLVVSIDAENPGKLVVSRRAYDRSVAGIISGAGGISPGLVMGQQGSIADGKQPVALSGRVWAYCDATKNPIKPGDLLTTSSTPGHAMKVRNYAKAQGAIIGKAMTGLKSGRGLVLVLVSLQ